MQLTGAGVRDAINNPVAYGETLGPELVTNGTFDSDTWWTKGAGITIAGGVGVYTSVLNNIALSRSVFGTQGRVYDVTYTIVSLSAGGFGVYINGAQTATRFGLGTQTQRITAGTADNFLQVRAVGTTTGSVDNVSIREVITGYLLPGLGGARLNASARSSVALQQKADGTYEYAAHNLAPNSNTFTSWLSTNAGTLTGGQADPFGGTSATLFSGASKNFYLQIVGLAAGTLVTISFWLRATGAPGTVTLGNANGGATFAASVTGSWQRFSLTFSSVGATDGPGLLMTGTLTSVEVFGGQINLGPTALPYVPTTAAAVYAPAVDWLSAQSIYGLRSEAAATNLVLWSANMSNAAWSLALGATKGSLTTAPDGTLSALPLTFGAIATSQSPQILAAGSAERTFSVFARSSTAKKFRLKIYTGVSDIFSADLTTSSAWTRFSLTATDAVANVAVTNEVAGGVGTVEFWCPQLETGSRASSPILTLAATATRAADLLIVPDTNAGLVGQAQGTIAVAAVAGIVGNLGVVSINDGSAADRVDIRSDGTTTVTLASTALSSPTVATMVAGTLAKTSMSYSLRAAAASRAGSLPVPVGDAPGFTQLQIGGIDGGTTANLDGWITSLQIAQTSSLPASLQGMTA
jgi:hypothetical protein